MTDRPLQLPFDRPTLLKHLNVKDPLALVIRAHLYVESALIRQIESALPNKQGFKTARLSFETKVKLAVALGTVEAADAIALYELNVLRNRFAHDLDTQLGEKDELDFYNALGKELRKVVDSERRPETPIMLKFRMDMAALILGMSVTE